MNYNQQTDEILQCRRNKDLMQFTSLLEEMRRELKKDKFLKKEEKIKHAIFTDAYLCEAYLLLGKIKEARKLGEYALKKVLCTSNQSLVPFLYNLLGYASGCMDDHVGASSYFCAGIEYASEQNDDEMLRILYSNFAITYMRLEQYDRAKQYIDKIYDIIQKPSYDKEKNELADKNYLEILSEYYFGIGEYEKSLDFIERRDRVYGNGELSLQYKLRSAIAYTKQGQMKQEEGILSDFLKMDMMISNPVMLFDTYFSLWEIAKQIENASFAEVCLKKMYAGAKKCDIPNLWVKYYECKIETCEVFKQEMDDTLFEKFYQYHQEILEQRDKNECSYIMNELEIFNGQKRQKELEKKNQKLIEISRLDELTKTYNRAGFQKHFAELFDIAYARQIPLGFCIMDIDHFKEVNDEYGHLAGDDCLKVVAKTIQTSFGKEAVVCRYGGDEFVVITLGVSDEIFEASLQKLLHHKNLVCIYQKENVSKKNRLTLSIGAVNCVPPNSAMETDYIYTADHLLYQVKGETRNGYRMENTLA